ncbi:MAG TPA: RidA family protein [Fimbriimonadaceae bacterium]|nr:RidA family protein [Fimbriimonadaceae bacterium]
MERQRYTSGSPWEESVGFSRAVRVGGTIHLAGTLDTDERGKPVGSDAYEQACNIFRKFERVLSQAGCTLDDIVRTRMFIVRLEDADEVGRAHKEFLDRARPAATMVQVAGFVGEGFLVEIEAEAVASPT